MSPIEKPSFLDLMDTSNMSLYHDLPRVSTEKVPRPHLHASGKCGMTSDEATSGDPGMAISASDEARRHTYPLRSQHMLEEPKHHLEATTQLTKRLTKRQKLDSEVKSLYLECIVKMTSLMQTPFGGDKVTNVRVPPHFDGKGDLLTFHRAQTSDKDAIQRAHREENMSSQQNVITLGR